MLLGKEIERERERERERDEKEISGKAWWRHGGRHLFRDTSWNLTRANAETQVLQMRIPCSIHFLWSWQQLFFTHGYNRDEDWDIRSFWV
jgi:hypothetical protein